VVSGRAGFALSVAGYLALLGWAWSVLPDGPVPLHFGAGGEPDRFGSRTDALATFAAIGLGTALLLAGAAALLESRRIGWHMVNLPHKTYWSADERRPQARRMMAEDLAWLGAGTMGLLCSALVATVTAARSGGSLPPWFWVALALYLVLVLGWTVRMHTSRYRPPQEA
jgi:hypothetical protein